MNTRTLSTEPGSASVRQIDWICDLLDSRELLKSNKFFDIVNAMDSGEYEGYIERLKVDVRERYSMDQASRMITALKELPKKNTEARDAVTRHMSGSEPEAGMYRLADGSIIRVYLGQQSGRMLAKKLVPNVHVDHADSPAPERTHEYEYMGKASRFVNSDTRKLSLEEAKEFGRMTGTCCVCARRLDDPESVEAGIGPVCGKRMSEGFSR